MPMEIHYQNSPADFRTYYNILRGPQKPAQRHAFYYTLAWYLTVLGLGCYLAIKHGKAFAACVFVTLAGFYVKQNWSFERQWEAHVAAYADGQPETSNRLSMDDDGIRESFSGIELHVAWSAVHGFSVVEDRLFVHFHKDRMFVIPLQYLNAGQREQIISALRTHGIAHRA